jgi:hypothetical protein
VIDLAPGEPQLRRRGCGERHQKHPGPKVEHVCKIDQTRSLTIASSRGGPITQRPGRLTKAPSRFSYGFGKGSRSVQQYYLKDGLAAKLRLRGVFQSPKATQMEA